MCCKIAISMCVDIVCMCYFSHVLVRYIDVLLFRQFFDCKIVFKFALIQNLKSLSSVLSQSLYLYVFLSQMAFHTFNFHRKESMEISLYFISFTENIDFLTIFYFIVLYLSYIFNTGTWWERKMLRGLTCSRRNRDVNKQRWVLQFSEFVWP